MRQVLVEKERGLFRCGQPETMAGSCSQNHLNISVQAGAFIGKERESRKGDQGTGCGCVGSVLAGPEMDL